MMTSGLPGTWQQECTQALHAAIAVGGTPGRTQWEAFRDTARQDGKRVLIADSSFNGMGLEGFDLARCWIGRSTFVAANLTNVQFVQTIFRDCDATDANIEGANFRFADMAGDGLILLTDKYNDLTNFDVAAEKMPDSVAPGLRIAAGVARRKRRLQYYRSNSRLVRAMLAVTNYGFSLKRLCLLGSVIVVAFAICFWFLGQPPINAALGSVKYFLSVNDSFQSPVLSAIGSIEALIGMIFFALFTTILVSLFLEKN
jgi:hypothetical protein